MDTVEEVKAKLEVTEVIGQYIQLKQAGRNLKAPCPFHGEKTASFMVSPEKGIWHCFGCHRGGDIFKFVMDMEGMEFREAQEKLARQAGVELAPPPSDRGAAKQKARLLEAHEWAVKYYQASLVKNPKALDYIRKRHLNKESLQNFQIGYAAETWEGLTNFMTKKGFSPGELKLAGLAGQKEGRTTVYDMFRGRIMLAICDNQGRPVGFTGRVLDEGTPKYLNTPQTPIYDKSRIIYGLHLAKEAIREHNEVILVEGNMDVVASHQAGVKQVVAVSGTALTLDQLKALSRLTKNIKLAFDQDSAGLAATERAIELGQKLGLNLKMTEIVGAKDPDELIQQDVKLWQKAISEAKYIVDYLFDRFEQGFDLTTAMGKRQYSDRLAANIHRLADPIEQDHYVKLLAQKLGASEDQVKAKVDQATPESRAQEATRKAVQASPVKPRTAQVALEEMVLAINLAYPDVQLSIDDLQETNFTDERRQIFRALANAHEARSAMVLAKDLREHEDYAKILTLRGEEEFSSLAPADRSFEAFTLVRRLQTLSNHKTKEQITRQLREAEEQGNTVLVRTLRAQYQALIHEDL